MALNLNIWCGYRDSNPGPHPWQGCALTAELHPHGVVLDELYRGKAVFSSRMGLKKKYSHRMMRVFLWWLLPDLNWGHRALQAPALPLS
jgi:hypothetical protein